MHRWNENTEKLAQAALAYAEGRLRLDPVPLDGPKPPEELLALAGQTITAAGLGGPEAMRVFGEVLAQACISTDNPRNLSFIPSAPTDASMIFDLVVGASSIYGGSWMEGAGAVFAENQALAWLVQLAGLPETAGGTFVQGGTVGNLSALVAARHTAQARREGPRPQRWKVAATGGAHSSIASAARVMDVDLIDVGVDDEGRMTGETLRAALDGLDDPDGVFAVVATAGTTNLGIIDRLDEVAAVAGERGIWFHVDGAYGLAALAAPSARPSFKGVEHADSFIVDPHKWLFAPFDCCALVYRDPELGRLAHTQHAGYLEPLRSEEAEWNPSDYAYQLTRRARGLPFWFSLATHGTDAYSAAVEQTLTVARATADEVRDRKYLDLLHEPELSVVAFRRRGWTPEQYTDWSDRLLKANFAFVVPTTHRGETVTRFAITNPRTTVANVAMILDTMSG